MGAADDLGLTPAARAEYKRRLSALFAEGCVIFGKNEAARLFRATSRGRPPAPESRPRRPPPRKQPGAHDPEGDRLLFQSWKSFGSSNKTEWARAALKHHAAKNRGKVRAQSITPASLVRKLNRILKNRSKDK
ncbi:hypothetical protein H8A95_21895 [Bradyrhizobium sp. Pear76]|uniref:hypothetical protein n=1 Tax=Bradyrhizobium oropedii TaxID=1571201 RepID=UPI001E5A22EE|nr:hypothetical protein [Bradyrhizobium oropedii]MCC8964891.1 hypothetical protein [Bradyrhizobium oropedii]